MQEQSDQVSLDAINIKRAPLYGRWILMACACIALNIIAATAAATEGFRTQQSVLTPDPMVLFCGQTCISCNHSRITCQKAALKTLKILCENSKVNLNCYVLWNAFSKTCRTICAE